MIEEKDTEENNPKLGISLISLFSIVCVVMVLVGVYQYISMPYNMADNLREELKNKDNVSEEYRQGWNDCIDKYLKITTGPSNMTDTGDN